MKKIVPLVVAVILMMVVSACGSGSEEKSVSLDQVIKAYQDAGVEVNPEEKPMFDMVKAKNGVIFKMDNKKVAIYEYASKKDADKAKEEYADMMKDWPQKGTLFLESNHEEAIKIFESVQ